MTEPEPDSAPKINITRPENAPAGATRPTTLIVELKGEVGLQDIQTLERELQRVAAQGPRRVVVKMDRLRSIAALAVGSVGRFLRGMRRKETTTAVDDHGVASQRGATSIVGDLTDRIPRR